MTSDLSAQASKSTCPQNVNLSTLKVSSFSSGFFWGKDDEWQSPTLDGWLSHKPKSRKVAMQSILRDVLREDISWVQSAKYLTNPNHA